MPPHLYDEARSGAKLGTNWLFCNFSCKNTANEQFGGNASRKITNLPTSQRAIYVGISRTLCCFKHTHFNKI